VCLRLRDPREVEVDYHELRCKYLPHSIYTERQLRWAWRDCDFEQIHVSQFHCKLKLISRTTQPFAIMRRRDVSELTTKFQRELINQVNVVDLWQRFNFDNAMLLLAVRTLGWNGYTKWRNAFAEEPWLNGLRRRSRLREAASSTPELGELFFRIIFQLPAMIMFGTIWTFCDFSRIYKSASPPLDKRRWLRSRCYMFTDFNILHILCHSLLFLCLMLYNQNERVS